MNTKKGIRKTGATAAAIAVSVFTAAFAANFIFVSAAPFIASVTAAPSVTNPVAQEPLAAAADPGSNSQGSNSEQSTPRKPSSTTASSGAAPVQVVEVENKSTPQPTTAPAPSTTTNPPQTTTTTLAPVTTTTRPPAACGATTARWNAVQVGMTSAAVTAATGCAISITSGTVFFRDIGSGDAFRVTLSNGVVTSKAR